MSPQVSDLLHVELIIVRDIWCRHYYFRPRYCRSNSSYKKLSVDLSIVTILHLRPRDTGKVAALGPDIMSPKGHKLLPEGRRAAGSRPEGGNFRPEGDIMWPVGGKFSSSPRGGAELAISLW